MPEAVPASDVRRLFVIGPMSDAGRPLDNTRNIKRALESILTKAGAGPFEVRIPDEVYGNDIPSDVFTAIDLSDLIVADISRRSPNVMYELAFAHALGIATILVDAKPPADAAGTHKKIFYLNQSRTVVVDAIAEEALESALAPPITAWLEGRSDLEKDPLTRFYGEPLVDISAVAGIAAGYVENFVAPVMKAITYDFKQQPVPKPHALVIVLPDNLDQIDRQAIELRQLLEGAFGKDAVQSPALVVDENDPARPQKRTVTYVNGVVVDLPRTLFPLRRSHRFVRAARAVRNRPDRLHIIAGMERRLVDRFNVVLGSLAVESGSVDMERMRVRRQGEVVETIGELNRGR